MTLIRAALEEIIDEEGKPECDHCADLLSGALDECDTLDALIIATVKRERAASVATEATKRQRMVCIACDQDAHVQCLGGRCECEHLVPERARLWEAVVDEQDRLKSAGGPSRLLALQTFSTRKFVDDWAWNSGDGATLFNGEYHERRAALYRFAEALKEALVAPVSVETTAAEKKP